MMELEYVRDYAMFTAIFGVAGFMWFGWAQERPRSGWRKYLGIASGVSLVLGLVGVFLSVTNWDGATALDEAGALTTYIIVFWVQLIIGVVVAIWLFRAKKRDLIAPWVTFLVGAHFFWLIDVFNDVSLYILGFILVVVALLAPYMAKKLDVASSAITGIGAGTLLFLFAVFGLVRFLLV